MGEKCPLGSTLRWANENPYTGHGIPEICTTQCGQLMETAVATQAPEEDIFTENCDTGEVCGHDIEVEDYSLVRGKLALRYYSALNVCEDTRTELFSETYTFECSTN